MRQCFIELILVEKYTLIESEGYHFFFEFVREFRKFGIISEKKIGKKNFSLNYLQLLHKKLSLSEATIQNVVTDFDNS